MAVNTKKKKGGKRAGKERAAETDSSLWLVFPSKDQINMQTTHSQLQQGAHSIAQSSVWLVKITQSYSRMERDWLHTVWQRYRKESLRERERERERVGVCFYDNRKRFSPLRAVLQWSLKPNPLSLPDFLYIWLKTGMKQPFLCIRVVLKAPTFMLEASVSSLVKWLELSCSSCRRFEFSIFNTSTCLSSWSYDAAAMLEDARLTCRPT